MENTLSFYESQTICIQSITAIINLAVVVVAVVQMFKLRKQSEDVLTLNVQSKLIEILLLRSNICNKILGYSLEYDDKVKLHCTNEVKASIEVFEHYIKLNNQNENLNKCDFVELFWLNLNTRIRKGIGQNDWKTISTIQVPSVEYQEGHQNNLKFIRDELLKCKLI